MTLLFQRAKSYSNGNKTFDFFLLLLNLTSFFGETDWMRSLEF